jgi:5-methylcytosine-specific restriction endonuclease McrBC GTP-binding regulatory subunit McrB
MFSPKVLDRAFTIEFREVNLDDYLQSFETRQNNISKDDFKKLLKPLRDELLKDLRNNEKFCAAVADKNEVKNAINELDPVVKELSKLNQILQLYDLHFGYRVLDEIALFIKYATSAPDVVGKLDKDKDKDKALDFAVLMKVLPKFHGPRQKLERPLWLVLGWCLENKFDNKTSEELIKEIWKKLNGEDKRPSIEDLTNMIQKLKSEMNNRSKNESQKANLGSQTIDKKQNQTTEESPESTSKVSQEANPGSETVGENQNQTKEGTHESTSEVHQTEQTSIDNKTLFINRVKYPRTAIKVLTMLRQLYETGFTSFA